MFCKANKHRFWNIFHLGRKMAPSQMQTSTKPALPSEVVPLSNYTVINSSAVPEISFHLLLVLVFKHHGLWVGTRPCPLPSLSPSFSNAGSSGWWCMRQIRSERAGPLESVWTERQPTSVLLKASLCLSSSVWCNHWSPGCRKLMEWLIRGHQ